MYHKFVYSGWKKKKKKKHLENWIEKDAMI